MACKFMIIGGNESPAFELDLGPQPREMPHMADFILHSSLDLVEDAKWKTKEMFVALHHPTHFFFHFTIFCFFMTRNTHHMRTGICGEWTRMKSTL